MLRKTFTSEEYVLTKFYVSVFHMLQSPQCMEKSSHILSSCFPLGGDKSLLNEKKQEKQDFSSDVAAACLSNKADSTQKVSRHTVLV